MACWSPQGNPAATGDGPLESHAGGIMNTLVPEAGIPSHQGPDARSVDPELDVVTMAVKVPQTLRHMHFWSARMTRPASRDDVLAAFRSSGRIALISTASMPGSQQHQGVDARSGASPR